jgi:osmotically-inducible protein OsmY
LLAACHTTAFQQVFSPYPQGMTLNQSVQDALMRSGDPYIAQVHVDTQKDIVILSGYVKKIKQSDVAEQIARQVPGVKMVENNIIVRP